MNTNPLFRIAVSVALFAVLTVGAAQGQGFFNLAPMNAMNTLNSGPTGGGGTGQLALDRARGMGGPMGMNQGLGVPGQPMSPGMTGLSALGQMTGLVEPRVTAIKGNRVYCRVTGQLLNDAQLVYLTEPEAKQSCYDDGTHGDSEPGDGVWTSIGEDREDVLSQEADILRRRVQGMVIQAEAREPMDFYLLHAVTLEPVSLVESEIKLEAQRDEKVLSWASKFLEKYRQDPEDTRSPFWPLYIPPPPSMPTSTYPVGFDLYDLPPELGGATVQEEEQVIEDAGYDDYEDEDYEDE